MEKKKILVINDEGGDIKLERDIISESFVDSLDSFEVKYIPATNRADVIAELPDADAVISVYTEFDREMLGKMKKCKIIATQTIGINTIDLDVATELGICITNVPDYCLEEVALHTVSLTLSCVRKITIYNKIAREKIWNIEEIYKYGELHRLTGQKYGLVSLGNIGKRVAEIMKAFGMEIMAYDPFISDKVFNSCNIQKAETLEELFSSCNIISLHTPLTEKTKDMIGINLFKLMPSNAVLINTSRGEIIKEKDLYIALKEGIISAAGIDVIRDEINFETPLYRHENVIMTPHIAYYSQEALDECRAKAAKMVGDVIGRHIVPKYLVNKCVIKKARTILKEDEK